MPFLREISPAAGIHAGIWHITESADELLEIVQPGDPELRTYRSMQHDRRKRHWLACRALAKHLFGPLNAIISYDLHGRPYLDSGNRRISLSHAGEYAAVAYSDHPLGVDIERISDRVERVKSRFLRDDEMTGISGQYCLEKLYVFWGGKEAVYKLHGKPDTDLRNDIHIHPFDYLCTAGQRITATLTTGGSREPYTLYYEKLENYMVVVAY